MRKAAFFTNGILHKQASGEVLDSLATHVISLRDAFYIFCFSYVFKRSLRDNRCFCFEDLEYTGLLILEHLRSRCPQEYFKYYDGIEYDEYTYPEEGYHGETALDAPKFPFYGSESLYNEVYSFHEFLSKTTQDFRESIVSLLSDTLKYQVVYCRNYVEDCLKDAEQQ